MMNRSNNVKETEKVFHFTVREKLPGLNEYIHDINRSAYIGNRLKRDTQDTIALYIRAALARGTLAKVTDFPVCVRFIWHERTRRRDLDNIASAKKFILDALIECGVLPGDGQKYVCGIHDEFVIPAGFDGVRVELLSDLTT